MASRFRVKRRDLAGGTGAPTAAQVAQSELVYNETDEILYVGSGGNAAASLAVKAIAGAGAVVTKVGDQSIAGIKTFAASPIVPAPTASGQVSNKGYVDAAITAAAPSPNTMLTTTYDTTSNGIVDNSEKLGGQLPSFYAAAANAVLTGNPTAPTATLGTNSTTLATAAFVQAAIANLVNAAPLALDQLSELATAIGNDPNFSTTLTNSLALKANTALSNLSVAGAAAAAALGLGNMSLQASSAVNITGGTIDNVTFDGGTY